MNISKIPLGSWIDSLVDWITTEFDTVFDTLTAFISVVLDSFIDVLSLGHPFVLIAVIALLAFYTSKWTVGVFALVGLLLIDNLGYWNATVSTIALVLSAVVITIVIAIPIGIWTAQSDIVRRIVLPILDFMQTMPAFVYLIPSILFFGIGVVPGIIASVIFAIAPAIRLTNLGIREVPNELIEASDAFGTTSSQKLFKVQLPLAAPTIMAGINQSIMLSLSMVVIASLVGAPGLGAEVYRAVTQIQVGQGFEAGLSIVIIAIILDRVSQNLGKPAMAYLISKKYVYSIMVAVVLFGFIYVIATSEKKDQAKSGTVGEAVNYQIIGIDPGAGLMKLTKEAMVEYGLEQDWTLREGSSAAMTAQLQKAYKKKEPIIITGWTPHWMFQKYDLKYLDDPKGTFGTGDDIHTITRKGFAQENPGAATILDRFFWTPSDMEEVMNSIQEGLDDQEAAKKWIQSHSNEVQKWTKGIAKGNGEPVILVYVAWESEVASTNVIGAVLDAHGYDVQIKQVEMGPMYAGIADGSADAMVAAWLPTTSKDYYEKYKTDLVDLGPNLKGTKLGLTVPEYMEINSIEDLNK